MRTHLLNAIVCDTVRENETIKQSVYNKTDRTIRN